MNIVLVHVHVKPEMVDAFKQATIENANQSAKEEGVERFDVIQQNSYRCRAAASYPLLPGAEVQEARCGRHS